MIQQSLRDRVANAYLPDSATMRVANAWVVNGISPTIPERSAHTQTHTQTQTPGAHSDGSNSGLQSPAVLEKWPAGQPRPPRSAHLPHEPQPGAHPLEWVNTELLLSLGEEAPEAPTVQQRTTPPSRTPPSESAHASRHGSRFPSRRGSRANSRAASPERSSSDLTLASGENGAPGTAGAAGVVAARRPEETFVHSQSTASRNMHGLFHIAMKPFTSLTSTFSLAGSRAAPSGLASGAHSPLAGAGSGANTPQHPAESMTSQEMLHHAFTQVPDYGMASRGFLGGGITPLETLRDLPTYESVQAEMRGAGLGLGMVGAGERSFSEGDLAGMFAAHGAHTHAHRALPGRSGLGRVPPRAAVATP